MQKLSTNTLKYQAKWSSLYSQGICLAMHTMPDGIGLLTSRLHILWLTLQILLNNLA